MALYYEAAQFLDNDASKGSLKSRVFSRDAKIAKSSPKQVFALVSEAAAWSKVLSQVIDDSSLLAQEHKLTPALALLLVHDLLLAKRGITAPSMHPLRQAVTRHRARLQAELARIRIAHKCATTDALRHAMKPQTRQSASTVRWLRINSLKTTLQKQLSTTFHHLTEVSDLTAVFDRQDALYVDHNVENLVAVSSTTDIGKVEAYNRGAIICQDKASCFPAFLLDVSGQNLRILDACAAPGNKTTHLAALACDSAHSQASIHACERDRARAKTLQQMIDLAGASSVVSVHAGQDFLRTDPYSKPWNTIEVILLDPSCSGSGMLGREEAETVILPSARAVVNELNRNKKKPKGTIAYNKATTDEGAQANGLGDDLAARLKALSTFQLKMILHAFTFPRAQKVVYSTCSIHAEEDEHVVARALLSEAAHDGGWQVLRRDEQVAGLKQWHRRGREEPFQQTLGSESSLKPKVLSEACLRCEKNTQDATQGFFVAGFFRSLPSVTTIDEDDEWNGFGD